MMYQVEEVRKVKHPCKLFGKVTVVRVRPMPIRMLIPSNAAIEGIKLKYTKVCKEIGCTYYSLCNPICLRDGDEVRVLRVIENVSVRCRGRKLIAVEAEIL